MEKPEDGFDSRASRRNTSASHLRVLTSGDKSVLFQVIDFVVICDDSSRQLHRGGKNPADVRGYIIKGEDMLGEETEMMLC